jgi:hypothetical protein
MRPLLSSRDWAVRLSVLLVMVAGLAGPVAHPIVHGGAEDVAHHGESDHAPESSASDDCALCVASAAPTTPRNGAPIPAFLVEGVQVPAPVQQADPDWQTGLTPRAPPVA